uniref:class I SAM-dependent methyltransferase n=1 Tax=Pedobacter schmidteae TaxID=2201271 RepID=UPI0013CE9F98|nr:class I SAM-dependent methyltransferase [Pedobacter schmidteae]
MKNTIQSIEELNEWHSVDDPWDYHSNPEDRKRKEILLTEIPALAYKNVLDIGCGQGFITTALPGEKVTGIDISAEAIKRAQTHQRPGLQFQQGDIFKLSELAAEEKHDLIIITGVLYPQYIGYSNNLIYHIIDQILKEKGILITVHIDEWYHSRFPYLMVAEYAYQYQAYCHRLEVYSK